MFRVFLLILACLMAAALPFALAMGFYLSAKMGAWWPVVAAPLVQALVASRLLWIAENMEG